jgi:ABC-2 type transport system ATP-binding protein
VLSSHQMAEVELVCSHAAILRCGRLVATGSVSELVGERPRVRLEVDDREGGIAILQTLPGISRAVATGRRAVTVEGEGLKPLALLEALDAAGLKVSSYRSTNFEDSYLERFDDDPSGPGRSGPNEP